MAGLLVERPGRGLTCDDGHRRLSRLRPTVVAVMAGPAPIGWRERASAATARGRLFFASYAPLALIFALRSIPHHWLAVVVWGIVALVGFVDARRLVYGARRRDRRTVRLERVEDAGGAVAAYLATYLLPFIASPPTRPADVAAYTVYFVVVFVVYVRSDMAVVNPTLYVLGWRVVDAITEEGRHVLVVCKTVPTEEVDLDVVQFLDVYVVKG